MSPYPHHRARVIDLEIETVEALRLHRKAQQADRDEWGADYMDADLVPAATFLAACCRGGFNRVAYQVFWGCDMVDVVVGPRFSAYSGDLRAGFIAYLHHVESRRNDPSVAASAASSAAGIDFVFYDRLETTTSAAYRDWAYQADLIELEEDLTHV